LLQRVLEHNESLQVRILEVEISRRKEKAEYGVFEPELVGSAAREENHRKVGSLESRTFGLPPRAPYGETNNIYSGGLEALAPIGTRIRLGYTLKDLRNSTQSTFTGTGFTNGEFQTFFGLTGTQPLLKGVWFTGTMSGIRLAAVNSEMAFQDYRKQLMIVISSAEAIYWDLYMAQQQLDFFKESVRLSETILSDARSRLDAGKGSNLDILEAEAARALRKSKQSEAEQKFRETANRLTALYSESAFTTNRLVVAVDKPDVTEMTTEVNDLWKRAFDLNPDYLMQRKKAEAEKIRLAYAKNQRLPELDLKGSYGLNGLGDTPNSSWRDVDRQDYPSWSIGLELHIPLAGGIKSRNELAAAKLRKQQTLIGLKEIETQIGNGLDTALYKLRSALDNGRNYETVLGYTKDLLNTRLAQLNVGKIEPRKVLEVEADMLEAKNALLDSHIQYRRARLELELIEGSVLQHRNIELTQRDLQARTKRLLQYGKLSDVEFRLLMQKLQTDLKSSPASL
jgi:outer membrane protein